MKLWNIFLCILIHSCSTIIILPNEMKESSLTDTNKKKLKNKKRTKATKKHPKQKIEKKEYKISNQEILTRPMGPMF